MEVSLDSLQISEYCICRELDRDILKKIQESYKANGQRNPVVILSQEGSYHVIAGRHRVEAARELGWDTIEADLKSYENQKYGVVNNRRIRKDIRNRELGEFCRILSQEFNITMGEIGELVGLSDKTVRDKISLLTDLENSVQTRFQEGEISARKGLVILQLPKEEQPEFVHLMDQHGWTRDDLRANLEAFQSDTLIMIGSEGRDSISLAQELRNKNVRTLVDVRSEETASPTPDELMTKFGRVQGIEYIRAVEFAPPRDLAESYSAEEIGDNEFGDQYRTYLRDKTKFDKFDTSTGKVAVLGTIPHPTPQQGHNHFCHRYFLAAELVEAGHFKRMYDVNDDTALSDPLLPPLLSE